MKILAATILLLCTFYIIKVDMFEGTIPLAYYPEEKCIETMEFIPAITIQGDTIDSLFSMYPANKSISHQDRLADFYKLNPHLVNQTVQVGEQVLLPIYASTGACK